MKSMELTCLFWGKERSDGHKYTPCACGCGYPTGTGRQFLKGHKEFAQLSHEDREERIKWLQAKEALFLLKNISRDPQRWLLHKKEFTQAVISRLLCLSSCLTSSQAELLLKLGTQSATPEESSSRSSRCSTSTGARTAHKLQDQTWF